MSQGLRNDDFGKGGIQQVMLTVGQVAEMLNCSERTVYRLSDSGRMPQPIKLGAMVRWRRAVIEAWFEAGCPAVGNEARKGGA